MRAYVLPALMAAGLVFAAAPASAQGFGVYVGPNGAGVRVAPDGRHYDRGYDDWRVSRTEAIRIARRNGMREVFDVERTRHNWIVRGVNYRGRRVAMRIDREGGWPW